MAAQNLSKEREFRYIVCWFSEFSELQREDFVPILMEYLHSSLINGNGTMHVNGLVNAMDNASIANKPMSLFQCRIKLFREWSVKWPLEFKQKLKEKIIEIDPTVGEKIMNEMKAHNGNANGLSNGSSVESDHAEVVEQQQQIANASETLTDDIVNAPVAATVNATEEAIITDNRLVAMLNNETSVDDDDDNGDGNEGNNNSNDNGRDNINNDNNDAHINAHIIEPAGQVHTQQQQTVLNNSAEVPLVA